MIELSRILDARRGKGRPPVYVDLPALPQYVEKGLRKIYAQAIREMAQGVVEDVLKSYSEALVKDSVRSSIGVIDERMVQVTLRFSQRWTEWANEATRIHVKAIAQKLKYATNINLETVLGATGVMEQQGTVQDLLDWNVGLIRSISDELRQKIASTVYSGLTARTPIRTVAREIREATGMSTARATRIASDQTVKLSSALDAQRLKDLGCEGYQWMHSGKAHPRIIHKERDGKFIEFGSTIDREDPPGHAPFCGCKRRMVL